LLTTSEISTLTIKSNVVILSACNSAFSGDLTSEGISELASAFMFAGSDSILASYWYVEASSTTDLITRAFDAYLNNEGLSMSKSLQVSIQEMISKPDLKHRSHPAYWAAFSYYGL